MKPLDAFLEFHDATLKGSSANRYRMAMGPVLKYLGRNLKAVTTADVARWMAYASKDEGLTGQTIVFKLKILRRLFQFMIEENIFTGQNPVNLTRLPQVVFQRFERLPFTYEQHQAILREAENTDRHHPFWPYACRTAWHTGLRLSDVANLKREHVNLFTKEIHAHTRKKSSRREKLVIPIEPELEEYLTALLDTVLEGYISPMMQAYYEARASDLSEWFKVLCIAAGCPRMTYHCYRHSMVSNLLNGGADVLTVRAITGQTTEVIKGYAHISTHAKAIAMANARAVAL